MNAHIQQRTQPRNALHLNETNAMDMIRPVVIEMGLNRQKNSFGLSLSKCQGQRGDCLK